MIQQTKVRGLVDCTGLWGTLNVGQELDLDRGIAESLILGGLAEPVEPEQERSPQDNERAAAEAAAILAAQQAQAGQTDSENEQPGGDTASPTGAEPSKPRPIKPRRAS